MRRGLSLAHRDRVDSGVTHKRMFSVLRLQVEGLDASSEPQVPSRGHLSDPSLALQALIGPRNRQTRIRTSDDATLCYSGDRLGVNNADQPLNLGDAGLFRVGPS